MIAIGNQTSWRASKPLVPYEFAVAQGFDAFEWFSDRTRSGWSEEEMSADERKRIKEEGAAKGIRFSVHAPFAANPLNAEGVLATRRSLDFAADLGAAVVNVHPFFERGIEAFAVALQPLISHAKSVNVRISVENVPPTTPEEMNELFAALSGVANAAGIVGMCLDMGHANLCPATRGDYNAFVDQLGDHVPIIHWHAHENWGDRDAHLTLFTGPSATDDRKLCGLVQRLLQRGFSGSAVLEVWPSPPDLLVLARDQLKALLDKRER